MNSQQHIHICECNCSPCQDCRRVLSTMPSRATRCVNLDFARHVFLWRNSELENITAASRSYARGDHERRQHHKPSTPALHSLPHEINPLLHLHHLHAAAEMHKIVARLKVSGTRGAGTGEYGAARECSCVLRRRFSLINAAHAKNCGSRQESWRLRELTPPLAYTPTSTLGRAAGGL